jgi:hypothetical protein
MRRHRFHGDWNYTLHPQPRDTTSAAGESKSPRSAGPSRIRARGAGAKDRLTTADRVLATVLYLRKLGTRDLLAQLFGVNGSTLTRAVHQVQPLLAEHGYTIPPSTARFRTPADVTAFLANSRPTEIKSAC